MNETILSFPIDIGDVYDVDLLPDGSLISVQGWGKRQILVGPGGPIELPESWEAAEYPHLRCISADRLLLIDTGNEDASSENAFILTPFGQLVTRFHLGPGVLDATPCANAFAVAYHADAAYEFGLELGPMANTGVAIFDAKGRMLANLNQDLERDGYQAANIQCMVARESGELVLIPEFLSGPGEELNSPVVFYDWRSGRIRIERSELLRPLAVSSRAASLFIYSPEQSEDEVFQCNLKAREQKSLGFVQHVYRGLPGGRFLSQLSGVKYGLLEMKPEAKPEKGPAATPRLLRHP